MHWINSNKVDGYISELSISNDFNELWKWSVNNPKIFWKSIWEFTKVQVCLKFKDYISSVAIPYNKWNNFKYTKSYWQILMTISVRYRDALISSTKVRCSKNNVYFQDCKFRIIVLENGKKLLIKINFQCK